MVSIENNGHITTRAILIDGESSQVKLRLVIAKQSKSNNRENKFCLTMTDLLVDYRNISK